MAEKYSRVEKDIDKFDTIDKLLLAFLILFALINVILLLTTDVSASSDYHNVVTNAIYTGTSHCSTNQTGLCVSDTSSTSYSRYTFGTTSYQNTLSMNFWLNTSVRSNVNATIRLTGSNWANVSYTCQTNYFTDCRVVRASSTILNINFSNTSNAVSGVEFFITANGSILNTNSTFYVQKADLYETLIVDNDQSTQDIINNQNDNTQEIISNANQNTQDVIQQVKDLISSNDKNSMDNLNNARTSANSVCKNYYNAPILYGKKQLSSTGVLVDSNVYSYYTEQYINIDIISSTYGDRLGIKNPAQSVSGYRFILYDSSYNFISTTNIANRNVVIPSNAQYFRFASPVPSTYIYRGSNCVSSSDETNDLIKDDSVDQNQANSFFNDFSTQDNGGISSLITKPLRIIDNLLSNNS